MKKTQEVIGLPIISISDGMEVGKVKSIIINADKGAIDYIVVDSGIQILSARVIPTDNILGIGEYALTIENDNAINDISKIPAAIDLLQKNIQVKGTKVLTKKGRLIGEIGDLYIDEDECCKIVGLEYIADITQKRIRLIPRDSVITFGKNLVVVTDDVENTLVDRSTQLNSGDMVPEVEKKNLVNFSQPYSNPTVPEIAEEIKPEPAVVEIDSIISAKGNDFFNEIEPEKAEVAEEVQEPVIEEEAFPLIEEQVFQQEEVPVESPVETVAAEIPAVDIPEFEPIKTQQDSGTASSDTSAASLFEQRQKQYLNGRKATKTITDNLGNVIVSEGSVITNDLIELAKQNGKLIELVMNNKA